MNVGDLIRDREYPEAFGIIVYKDEHGDANAYHVLANNGKLEYLSKDYVEDDCEVINESR